MATVREGMTRGRHERDLERRRQRVRVGFAAAMGEQRAMVTIVFFRKGITVGKEADLSI